MSRRAVSWALCLTLGSVLVYWVASNTEWADVQVPMLPKGEAATNPFYAAQRFAEALGSETTWDRQLVVPSREAVLVVSAWHWDLTESRRYALERWVESGGRLVVVGPLSGGEDEFERWSGVTRTHRRTDPDALVQRTAGDDVDPCHEMEERHATPAARAVGEATRTVCDLETGSFLETRKAALWTLRDPGGIQVMRVAVGRGHVTVVNARPFTHRNILYGDHDWLFVAATELRAGDRIHFLSEDDHPSLLALSWTHGGPVIVLALAAIGLALWRNGTRFGPLGEPRVNARRSLAEQIRGTGQFALRHGDGESLHDAAVRALTEAAERRIPGYARSTPAERARALAHVTGYDRDALTAAVYHAGLRNSGELRETLAFLESARREVLRDAARAPVA